MHGNHMSRVLQKHSFAMHYGKDISPGVIWNLIDLLLVDDDEKLAEIDNIPEICDIDNLKYPIVYVLPPILENKPPFACVALFFGAVKCFRLLQMMSVNLSLVDECGRGVTHFAAAGGCMEIIRELDSLGFKFQVMDQASFTPAYYAVQFGHLDCLQWMWQKGIEMNTRGLDYDTPLKVACMTGRLEIVKFLIECCNCSPNYDGEWDWGQRHTFSKKAFMSKTLPVHYAATFGHPDIIEYLISKGAICTILDRNKYLPITLACERGNLSCVKVLLPHCYKRINMVGATTDPLIQACYCGHTDIVNYLLSMGMNPNIQNACNCSPADAAIGQMHFNTAETIFKSPRFKPSREAAYRIVWTAAAHGSMEFFEHTCEITQMDFKTCLQQEIQMLVEIGKQRVTDHIAKNGGNISGCWLSMSILDTHKCGTNYIMYLINERKVSPDRAGMYTFDRYSRPQRMPPILAALFMGRLPLANCLYDVGAKLDASVLETYPEAFQHILAAAQTSSLRFILNLIPDLSFLDKRIFLCSPYLPLEPHQESKTVACFRMVLNAGLTFKPADIELLSSRPYFSGILQALEEYIPERYKHLTAR